RSARIRRLGRSVPRRAQSVLVDRSEKGERLTAVCSEASLDEPERPIATCLIQQTHLDRLSGEAALQQLLLWVPLENGWRRTGKERLGAQQQEGEANTYHRADAGGRREPSKS